MSQWVNGSVDGSMGRMGHGSMGQWVNGSWVSDTMGQMGHGSPMVTHGPLCSTPVAMIYYFI